MKLRLSLLLALGVAACAEPAAESTPAAEEQPLTDVHLSPNVEQTISDCWDMGTSAWIEALSRRPAGAAGVDISEAYVSYIYWLLQLTETPDQPLSELGSYGKAAEILRRYGWMTEADFLSLTEPTQYAVRHWEALSIVRAEIATGELKTKAQRTDRAHVIAVLNRAWGVLPSVQADLAAAFGAELGQTLRPATDLTGSRLHRLSEIAIGHGDDGKVVTAEDVVGTTPAGTSGFSSYRLGKYAFSAVPAPADDAKLPAYWNRAQRALNQDLPLPMAYWNDQAALDETGTFQRPASGAIAPTAGSHLVLVFDDTVATTAFGVLPAGVPETRAEARAATLLPDSKILSLRARNSAWGSYMVVGEDTAPYAADTPGLDDYALDYLTLPSPSGDGRVLQHLVMPNNPNLVIAK